MQQQQSQVKKNLANKLETFDCRSEVHVWELIHLHFHW